jgi:hypothetical protein
MCASVISSFISLIAVAWSSLVSTSMMLSISGQSVGRTCKGRDHNLGQLSGDGVEIRWLSGDGVNSLRLPQI